MMRSRTITAGLLAAAMVVPHLSAQQSAGPTFRASSNLVRVDVIVRDRDGRVVPNLRAEDFIVTEDGKPQTVLSFAYEDASSTPSDGTPTGVLSLERLRDAVRISESSPASVTPPAIGARELSGRRLIILLFDTSSMQPSDASRALKAASNYVREQLSPRDLVAIATVGQTLSILTDFTSDRETLGRALAGIDITEGTGFDQPTAAEGIDLPLDSSEFAVFNNDRRLRALKVLATALAPLDRKKAILYFSAGLTRSGTDNQVELRAAINAASRANVSIYPVDSRGLVALAPGGDASDTSDRDAGRGAGSSFSGAAMLGQLGALSASQDTLTTLAVDTGGEVFTDTNDFGPAFTRVQNDLSGYYLLGYNSQNTTADGRFRRIGVRLRNTGQSAYRVEARNGYYATVDFSHLKRVDRERQLQDQITAALSATDVPVVASTSWFRLTVDRYYVPISVALPGSVLQTPNSVKLPGTDAVSVDFLGVFLDEQGRSVGRLRDTVLIPSAQVSGLAAHALQYQSGVTLPAGHYRVKVVVRENTDGMMGSFEFPIVVPEIKAAAFAVSPIVFATQLRALSSDGARGTGRQNVDNPTDASRVESERRTNAIWSDKSPNPLVRDGRELVQSLSHIATRGQPMYFYYEVYNPASTAASSADTGGQARQSLRVRSSVACYRGETKAFESAVVERTTLDVPERQAVIFRLQLPTDELEPGLYACQVNVIDTVAGQFAFPRIAVYIR